MLSAVSVKTPGGDARPSVVAATEVPLPTTEREASALRSVLAAVDRSLPLLVVLGRSQYRLMVVNEPAVPERDMTSTLRWSVSAEGDDVLEDFILGWIRIPTEQAPARPKQVYAVTTPTAAMDTRMTVWRQARIRPKVVDIRETSLRNLSTTVGAGEGAALLQADEDGVSMVFTHQGSLYMNRFMEQSLTELAASDAAAGRRAQERIAQQLARSIDMVDRTFPFMPITRVAVAPGPGHVALVDALRGQLSVPVESLDLAQSFDLSAVPTLAKDVALQSRALVALGAALRP